MPQSSLPIFSVKGKCLLPIVQGGISVAGLRDGLEKAGPFFRGSEIRSVREPVDHPRTGVKHVLAAAGPMVLAA
jgi:hypothetical protein